MGVMHLGVSSEPLARRLEGLVGVFDGDCGKDPGISSLSWSDPSLVGTVRGV